MLLLMTTSASNLLAIVVAAVGALLFGLAAVRQHGAVQAEAEPGRSTLRQQLGAALRLVRDRSWVVGAVQAGLGAALHVVALALAPITLVQPVGVLAVPVTVVATAIARRRRPARSQVLGTLLSVGGVAALTVVLLLPAARAATLPAWTTLATGVGVLVGGGVVLVLVLSRAPALVRCTSRAVVAAALFGLNSILLRTLGEVFGSSSTAGTTGLVVTSVVGIAVSLPLGVWLMQSAYLFGSPQVVICCLTLVDPLSAVVGGRTLLQDGAAISGPTLAGAVVCALVAAVGVVLLARDYPVDAAAGPPPSETDHHEVDGGTRAG